MQRIGDGGMPAQPGGAAGAADKALPRPGARLRHARLLRGPGMRDLALRVGCPVGAQPQIEGQKAYPSTIVPHRICSARDTSPVAPFAGGDGAAGRRS